MRPWADDAHLTFQHIPKLWKFIEAGFSQDPPDFGNPFIAFGGLLGICLFIVSHASELVAPERLVVFTAPYLNKQNRAGRFELYQQSK
jgi:hypothetical protein